MSVPESESQKIIRSALVSVTDVDMPAGRTVGRTERSEFRQQQPVGRTEQSEFRQQQPVGRTEQSAFRQQQPVGRTEQSAFRQQQPVGRTERSEFRQQQQAPDLAVFGPAHVNAFRTGDNALRQQQQAPDLAALGPAYITRHRISRCPVRHGSRRGQSLVEFAVVALVLYMLLAAILTFGHALYVAQGLQQAADLASREISRTPLPAVSTFGEALEDDDVRRTIFDDAMLVIDLDAFYEDFPVPAPDRPDVYRDLVPTLPLLNQQLMPLMIVDRPDFNGDGTSDAWLLRYPGALLERTAPIEPPDRVTFPPTGPYLDSDNYSPWIATNYTVGIPIVTSRAANGVETIRWVPVVEQIQSEANPEPFSVASPQRGIVALRINYPFQSASMSSFRRDPTAEDYPFEPTVGRPNAADDGGVTELNPGDRPGELTGDPLTGPVLYAGTYGGQYGLGAQGALGSDQLTGGRPVRPYRRVISAQAIYRREVFSD